MLIGFHLGRYREPNSIVSTTNRIDGAGGKMNSFCAMYSLRMSFWIVPPSRSIGTPCFSAAAMYIAQMIAAGGLVVMLRGALSGGNGAGRKTKVLRVA